MAHKPAPDNDDDPETPLLEWAFGALGLALFVGALVVTIVNGLHQNEPAAISTRVEAAAPMAGRYRIEFEAVNAGDMPAAQVQLRAALKEGDTTLESSVVEIDLLPPHASRRAGVMFDHNPEGRNVEIKAMSYQQP